MRNLLFLKVFIIASAGSIAGCSASAIAPETEQLRLPEEWARGGEVGTVGVDWLTAFDDGQLIALVSEALTGNYQLEQERARLYQAEQVVVITRANRFPDLDVSLGGSRRSIEDAGSASVFSESFDASLDTRWQTDLWGRLSKQQQAAQLDYSAQLARLEQAERCLLYTSDAADE